MAVTIAGMFGDGKTYFADSPVVIDISGLEWSQPGMPVSSPFTVVKVEVLYQGNKVGDFRADTAGQAEVSFDISSALRAIWSDYEFRGETAAAQAAIDGSNSGGYTAATDGVDFFQSSLGTRKYREYSLVVYTEYLTSEGVFASTSSGVIEGGRCAIGGYTEWERSIIPDKRNADLSHLEHSNLRNGDASTKPTESPERVGRDSITSFVDVSGSGTKSVFYPSVTGNGTSDSQQAHAPLVLRDSQPYVDFLFLNRRGAIETCSGLTKEAMSIAVNIEHHSRAERPSFAPVRSLMAIGSDGRRSWQMSSGYVTREWADWWATEFIGGKRKRWWMLWQGPGLATPRYVPVVVEPAKKSINIYDRAKQQLASVDFTVTLALEG